MDWMIKELFGARKEIEDAAARTQLDKVMVRDFSRDRSRGGGRDEPPHISQRETLRGLKTIWKLKTS